MWGFSNVGTAEACAAGGLGSSLTLSAFICLWLPGTQGLHFVYVNCDVQLIAFSYEFPPSLPCLYSTVLIESGREFSPRNKATS